jgi:hypothetical protein
MPFDPSYPPTNAEIESAPLRAQLTSLKALIDAVPTITGAVLDGVTTGAPGDPASVNLSIVGTELHFSFSIPQGNDGATGPQGEPGPPFASATVDGVTTLDPGNAATVDVTYDGSNVHFAFGLPRGADGSNGEVNFGDLANAINDTSNNSNAVSTLDDAFVNDPPTLADLELMRAKVNELILALRR